MMMGFAPGANTSFWIISDWIYEFANEILSTPGGFFFFQFIFVFRKLEFLSNNNNNNNLSFEQHPW